LCERIEFYAGNPDAFEEKQCKIKKFAQPQAADRIVNDIYNLVRSG